MADKTIPEYRVHVDQLRPGVFIRMEKVNWFKHPFLFSSFKLKYPEQVMVLKDLGITHVICVPEKSDRLPVQAGKQGIETPKSKGEQEKSRIFIDQLWQVKHDRAEKLRRKKKRLIKCEQNYTASLKEVTGMMDGIVRGNPHSVAQASKFVETFIENFLSDVESTLHLLNIMGKVESIYYHSLNVAVLSMMLGREAGLQAWEMNFLGMGALFHDIGKTKIKKSILKKPTPLTKIEAELVRKHPQYGKEILLNVPEFPYEAINIVLQHHERFDGSGYPDKLKGEQIYKLARILHIADVYDNHCNHADPSQSLTPYQALSFMFSQQKSQFDPALLAQFIRCLGVYPPGTVVLLSNGSIGMVIAVNHDNQLCPSLVMYDPEIPKKEALVIDLREEPDLRVEKSIRPAQLPPEIFDYLSPRTRITYYVDPAEEARKNRS